MRGAISTCSISKIGPVAMEWEVDFTKARLIMNHCWRVKEGELTLICKWLGQCGTASLSIRGAITTCSISRIEPVAMKWEVEFTKAGIVMNHFWRVQESELPFIFKWLGQYDSERSNIV